MRGLKGLRGLVGLRGLRVAVVMMGLMALAGCRRQAVERVEWVSMGTVAAVQARGAAGDVLAKARSAAQMVCGEVELLLNAHEKSSEISRLAGRADEDVLAACDAKVRPCYAAAFALAKLTAGAFNPRWRGANTLDLGAIAKGYAVDLAAQAVTNQTETGDILLDLGGNLKAVRGDWTVGVKDGETFMLREGEACATSARYYRGEHIKDGRTGADVANGLYSVTVIHPTSAMLADGLSTVLFILGREKGMAFVKEHYPEVRVFWL